MDDVGEVDFDLAVDAAWKEFETGLRRHLARMTEERVLLIETLGFGEPEVGATPYVQFCVEDDALRGEAVSKAYLAVDCRLSPQDERTLERIGWTPPNTSLKHTEAEPGESSQFTLDAPQARSRFVARRVTRALREVYGVPTPDFLWCPPLGLGADVPLEEDLGSKATAPDGVDPADVVEPMSDDDLEGAHWVQTPDQTRWVVRQALAGGMGGVVKEDEDGDIPVRAEHGVVFVRFPDEPRVEMFSPVVRNVSEVDRARLEVSILNRDSRFVRWFLQGETVFLVADVSVRPLVGRQVVDTLETVLGLVDRCGGDLALRTGGQTFFEGVGPADAGSEPGER